MILSIMNCSARCHRIGQTQPVDIFRFSMEGFGRGSINIENYITDTQIIKRKKMITSDDCWNATHAMKQRTLIV